ncbi:hypothetical protein DEGR_35930 (plasmid) [Deinococcus grandis]|nr:hypothetical protein DEGR_35930 [Deinococcus grandis]
MQRQCITDVPECSGRFNLLPLSVPVQSEQGDPAAPLVIHRGVHPEATPSPGADRLVMPAPDVHRRDRYQQQRRNGRQQQIMETQA